MTDTQISRRFICLVRQLRDDGKTQADVARKLGIDQTYVSKLLNGSRTGVSASTVGGAIERMKLSPAYFHDPGPDDLDHRDYLGGSPAPTATYDLDDAKGIQVVEDYLADLEAMGADVDPAHAAALRDFRPSAYQPDREMVMKVYKDIVRLSRAKTPARADIEPPKLRPGRVKLPKKG